MPRRPSARSSSRACSRSSICSRSSTRSTQSSPSRCRRRDGRAARAPGQGAGQARCHRRLGSRFAAGDGDGRAALPAGRDARCAMLSGGEKRRVGLCRLLLQKPDILLLDEPTNHLDAESVAWLEQHLQQYAGTVIAVTHDRYFLDNVAGWILELDRGARHSVERQLLVLAGTEAGSVCEQRREDGNAAAEDARSANWNGSACRRKAGTPKARRASMRTKRCSAAKRRSGRRISKSTSRPARASGRSSSKPTVSQEAYGDTAADRRHEVPSAARRHRRRHRPERRRQDDALPHDHGQEKPDAGTIRSAKR